MLIDSPDQSNQTLEFIFLAIKLAAKDAGHPFVQSLNKILKDANKILSNPNEFAAKGTPESVDFAFYLHMHPELKELFSKAKTFEDINEKELKEIIGNRKKNGAY